MGSYSGTLPKNRGQKKITRSTAPSNIMQTKTDLNRAVFLLFQNLTIKCSCRYNSNTSRSTIQPGFKMFFFVFKSYTFFIIDRQCCDILGETVLDGSTNLP